MNRKGKVFPISVVLKERTQNLAESQIKDLLEQLPMYINVSVSLKH